jgi:hypothetical protein
MKKLIIVSIIVAMLVMSFTGGVQNARAQQLFVPEEESLQGAPVGFPCDPDGVQAFIGHLYLVHAVVNEIDLQSAYNSLSRGGFTAADIVRASDTGGFKVMFRTPGQTLILATDTVYRPFDANFVRRAFEGLQSIGFGKAAAYLNGIAACIQLMRAAFGDPDNWTGKGKWWQEAFRKAALRYRSNVPHQWKKPGITGPKFDMSPRFAPDPLLRFVTDIPMPNERDVIILLWVGAIVVVGYVAIQTGGVAAPVLVPVLAAKPY